MSWKIHIPGAEKLRDLDIGQWFLQYDTLHQKIYPHSTDPNLAICLDFGPNKSSNTIPSIRIKSMHEKVLPVEVLSCETDFDLKYI